MQHLRSAVIAALWLISGSQAASCQTDSGKPDPVGITIEYVDGRTDTVSAVRVEEDGIYVLTEKGGFRVPASRLSDQTLAELRMYKEIKRREMEAQGLVEHEGQWISKAEKQRHEEAQMRESEFLRKANAIVMAKSTGHASFHIFQPLDEGSLCSFDNTSLYIAALHGQNFYLLGATKRICAKGERHSGELYWAGTYTYVTAEDRESTVNCFAMDRNSALAEVRAKFGLFGDRKEAEPPAVAGPKHGGDISPDNGTDQPNVRSSGSGFVITTDGFVITNCHVVGDAEKVEIITEFGMRPARVVGTDKGNDLCLVKIEGTYTAIPFAEKRSADLGQSVFTMGFPMPDLQGIEPKVTKGVISSLRGIRDDARCYQIDAAVQPGNSGGPLADESGRLIGIVSSKLSDSSVLAGTGSLPQNVNYAIKKSYLLAFLDGYPEVLKNTVTGGQDGLLFEDAVAKVRKSTVLVICK